MNLRIYIVLLVSLFTINLTQTQVQAQISETYILDSLRVDSMRSIQFSDQIAALKLGFEILEEQATTDANQITARTLNTVADILASQGYYALAEEYYAEAMRNCVTLRDSVAIGWIYLNMGNLDFKNKQYKHTRRNYELSLQGKRI